VIRTEGGRIPLDHPLMLGELRRLARRLDAPAPGLVLIGRRDLRSNNSWGHNAPTLARGPERCTLIMHPADAAARGLADGARVRLESRVGAVEAPLEVSDEVMPGVVSLPHGWGHDRPGTRLSVASRRPGVSANDVTDERVLDPIAGNPALNGVPVTVRAATAGDSFGSQERHVQSGKTVDPDFSRISPKLFPPAGV
jgi:anaerobic selenocysteine-containing dehydrogenase